MSKRTKRQGSPTVTRDAAHYGPLLARRVRLLNAAGQKFDEGDDDQAVVMAAILRLLLAESLIDRITPLKRLRFTDTSQHPESPGAIGGVGFGLTRILNHPPDSTGVRRGGIIYAPCAGPDPSLHSQVVFRDWWARDKVVYPSNPDLLTREFVVHEMANTDGVHIDDELDSRYESLSRDNHGFVIEGVAVTGSVAASAVRQIAWEVLNTLERELPDITGVIDTELQNPTPEGALFYRIEHFQER